MQTMIDELMNESMQEASCVNGSCNCRHCTHRKESEFYRIQQELASLELNLEQEEELELSRLLARAKELVKKGYNKIKPIVPVIDIVRRLIFPNVDVPRQLPPPQTISAPAPPRAPVNPDIAKWMEEQKKQKTQRDVTPGSRKAPMVQKPQKESSLMQELLTEHGF